MVWELGSLRCSSKHREDGGGKERRLRFCVDFRWLEEAETTLESCCWGGRRKVAGVVVVVVVGFSK